MKRVILATLWLTGMASMTCAADRAAASYAIIPGVTFSNNLGEQRWAPYVEARISGGGWRVGTQGELSRKVESGAGYRLGVDVERAFGPLVASGAYRYRNGGVWTKQTLWAGGGVRTQNVSLVVRRELPITEGGNGTVSGVVTLSYGRLEWQGQAYSYRPTHGGERQVGTVVSLGYMLSRSVSH